MLGSQSAIESPVVWCTKAILNSTKLIWHGFYLYSSMEFGFVYIRFDRKPQLKNRYIFIALFLRREWASINSSIILTQIINNFFYKCASIANTCHLFFCAEGRCHLFPQGTYFFPSVTTSQSPVYFMDSLGQLKLLKSDKEQVYRWLHSHKNDLKVFWKIYMCTHTHSHANLFIFGLCKETPSNPEGRCHLHTLPLNARALTGPPAGLLVVQALILAVKLPWLLGRQDLPQHIRWFFPSRLVFFTCKQ